MLKKYSVSILFSLSLIISACSTVYKPGIHEVFQVPEKTHFYTASTLWFTDPAAMSSLNYQNGNKITYGTAVDEISFDDDIVSFRVKKTGVMHSITLNKNLTLMRMNEYLKAIFTTSNPVELELKMDPVVFEKIKRGIVQKGMTKEQVLLAYGYPSKHRTPDTTLNTWIYEQGKAVSKRVIFRGGKVLRIVKN